MAEFLRPVTGKENDRDDTLKCLKMLVENVEPMLDPCSLKVDDRLTTFVTTPQFDEFKKWLARRAN